jgi:hypothetical protein
VDENSAVNTLASGARTTRRRSIAQRSQRSRRGIRMADKNSAVNTLASGARTTRRTKHRTEVTEWDSDGGRKFRCEHLGVRRENHAKNKASHRGHGGGLRVVDENSAVNTLASGARTTRRRKHRTEVTEVTEGDWDGGRKFRCEHLCVRRENQAKKKASLLRARM